MAARTSAAPPRTASHREPAEDSVGRGPQGLRDGDEVLDAWVLPTLGTPDRRQADASFRGETLSGPPAEASQPKQRIRVCRAHPLGTLAHTSHI